MRLPALAQPPAHQRLSGVNYFFRLTLTRTVAARCQAPPLEATKLELVFQGELHDARPALPTRLHIAQISRGGFVVASVRQQEVGMATNVKGLPNGTKSFSSATTSWRTCSSPSNAASCRGGVVKSRHFF